VNGALASPRERILFAVGANPGVHLREIPRIVGFSLRAVRYHLDAMQREELVTPHRAGRFVRFFPRGAFSLEERALIAALRVRAQREVLRALLARGPQRFSDLALVLPISRVSFARGLRFLEGAGIVRAGTDRRYALANRSAVSMRLACYRERFPDMLADAAEEIFEDRL
jgi:predicted transcriptional regulator